ncbi:hypothetical protein UlMin_027480 [Ulmus minor]
MNFKKIKVPGVPGGSSGVASALVKLGIIGGIGLYAATHSLYNVDGGHRAIVFNRILGVKDKFILKELTLYPWFERPIIYDVRVRPHLVESSTGSHDLQTNYNERVLPSIIHETLKVVVAQREIRNILTERAANFNIALDDVSITSLTFGREFTAAIEAKHVAVQEAERAKFVVEKAEQDKIGAIIIAQGKATSAQICFILFIFHLVDNLYILLPFQDLRLPFYEEGS